MRLTVKSPGEMEDFAARCAAALDARFNLYLRGELGAGKTTFARGLLRALGRQGAVTSPTYTLVETYDLGDRRVHHFDLYRLGAPQELDDMGYRDYLDEPCICLVEWPERGQGRLPPPDLALAIDINGDWRELDCRGHTDAGEQCLRRLCAGAG